MGGSALKYSRRVFSQGNDDASQNARITVLENNEYKITYYEVVSGASGTLTLPSGATINAGEFAGNNSIISEVDGSNKPTFVSPRTAGGTIITSTLNTGTGGWTISGTPTVATFAFIYSIKIKAINYSNLTYANIIESEQLTLSGTANRITVTGNVIDIASNYVGQNSITTLGTITTGTIGTGAVIGGATITLGSDATGDIYYRNASGVLTRLAAGAAGTFLRFAGTGTAPTVSTLTIPNTVTAGRMMIASSGNALIDLSNFTYSNGTLTLNTNSDTSHFVFQGSASANRGKVMTLGAAAGFGLSSLNSVPFVLQVNDTTFFQLSSTGNVVLGQTVALATNATNGFAYMPSGEGTPTGVPTAFTGKVAFYYDTTNNKIYIYNGAWKATAALT